MERFQYRQFKEATARLPEKILKKRVDKAGISNYLVKWTNSNEPTWELVDAVQDYLEVINDFNHFAITGERQPKGGNVMSRVIPSQQLPTTSTKKKAPLVIEDSLNLNRPQPVPQAVKKIKKIIPLCLVGNCQKNLLGQFRKYYNKEQDEISQVKIIINEEPIFEVSYQKRQDGTVPYPEYFQQEQFKLRQPKLYVSFLEQCIFEVKQKGDPINYVTLDYRQLIK